MHNQFALSGRKAITPVIVVLLLAVIAVTSALIFYLWTMSYTGELTRAGEPGETLSSMVKVEGVRIEGSTLIAFIRNIGDTRVRVDKLYVEKHGVTVYALDVEGGPVEIEPGRVVEVRTTLPGSLDRGSYTLRVGTVGGFTASFQLYYYGPTGGGGGGVPENWLQGWSYRREVIITERSGNTLSGYQIRLVLSPANFDYSKARSDGGDLRFTDEDGVTLLPYWIESWNPGGESVVWVRVPEIPANGQKRIYMYYGNPSATSASDADATFDDGILMHTKHNILGDPSNLEQQRQYWEQARDESGYGWRIISSFDRVSNHGTIGGTKYNIAFNWWCVFYVDTPGTWSFRYGPDAGLASSEFIDNVVRAQTYDDRWWAYNWNHPDVIYFSANLDEGWHVLEILAFEGCCDGGQSLQFKSPTDSTWKTFSTSNLRIKTHKYTSPEPSISIGEEESV